MRTDKQIIEETNNLALKFYEILGYSFKNEKPKLIESKHPTENLCWRLACEAQLFLRDTDINDVL